MRIFNESARGTLLIIVLVLVLAAFTACGGMIAPHHHTNGHHMGHGMNWDMGIMHSYPRAVGTPEQTRSDAEAVYLTIRDWRFEPGQLTMPTGKVDLIVTNEGNMPHGLWQKELGINTGVAAGETVVIPIDDSTGGSYTFYCNTALCGTPLQHNNMRGTLTIEG